MNIPKDFYVAILCNNGRLSVPAKCVATIVHYGFEVVRHISTVDSNFVVFVKSKSKIWNDVIPHDINIFTSVWSILFMPEACNMPQLVNDNACI